MDFMGSDNNTIWIGTWKKALSINHSKHGIGGSSKSNHERLIVVTHINAVI